VDQGLPPWELEEAERKDEVPAKPPWEDATLDGRGADDGPEPVACVPAEPAQRLTAAFAGAAGLTAVAAAMASARQAQAARLTGWPAGRLLRRHDPARALGTTAGARQAVDAAIGQAQQSEVDNATTTFADAVGGQLIEPWAGSLREAARQNSARVPRALADGVRSAAAGTAPPPGWWRLVTAWQWLLTVLAVAGVVLAVVIGIVHATGHHQGWIGELSLIPWLLVMAAAMLVLGYVTAVSCRNLTVAAADRERESARQAMEERVSAVTRDLVLRPAGQEIAQYERFRQELSVAAGQAR
jgi:hypothetical protein